MKKVCKLLVFLFVLSLCFSHLGLCAEWTFMLYLDADNNLESDGLRDFQELSKVGSNANINIVVQFDREVSFDPNFDDWNDCQRFYITKGMKPYVSNAIADWGDGIGGREVNMADSQTLEDFILWAMESFPAEKYALILWNHGGGWRDDPDFSPIFKDICWDNTSPRDCLTSGELKGVLKKVTALKGPLDLIGFDACLMEMVEVAYQIKDFAFVMVGPEEVVNLNGWPYDTILGELQSFPKMSGFDLGKIMVDKYADFYGRNNGYELSAIKLSCINNMVIALDNFAKAMMNSYECINIRESREEAEEYSEPDYIDLFDFANLLSERTKQGPVYYAAQTLKFELRKCILSEFHGDNAEGSHGLSIYFPLLKIDFNQDYKCSIIDLPCDTQWDEFLEWYFACNGYCAFFYDLENIDNEFICAGEAKKWNADDMSWEYPLPFNFTFYGKSFNKLRVSSNGFLDFISSDYGINNNSAFLKTRMMITPLWLDLLTNQPDCDIFIHQPSKDSICFRWAAKTYAYKQQINSEVILYKDGRIQFNYGLNESDKRATIGISMGNTECFTFSPQNDKVVTSYMESIVFIPKMDLIEILSQKEGAVLNLNPPVFSWQCISFENFRLQFSPNEAFDNENRIITVPKDAWMKNTSTDVLPPRIWNNIWNNICALEQKSGKIYWRIVCKNTNENETFKSEVRDFTIQGN